MPRQPTLVGQAVLIVVDIQKSAFMDIKDGIPVMPGYRANVERSKAVVAAAHDARIVRLGRAAAGGQTLRIIEDRSTRASTLPASASPAFFARSREESLRPSDAHNTLSPPAPAAAPIDEPI